VRYVTGTGTIPSASAPGKSMVRISNPIDYDGSYVVVAVGSPSSQYPWAIVTNDAGTLLMVLSRPAYTKNFQKLYGKEIKKALGSKYNYLLPISNNGCSYV
jgi:lipocalin